VFLEEERRVEGVMIRTDGSPWPKSTESSANNSLAGPFFRFKSNEGESSENEETEKKKKTRSLRKKIGSDLLLS
jgi:hypothetical protein